MKTVSRSQVLAYRLDVQGLHHEAGTVAVTDIPALDYGVQDTGTDGARWALVNRGADPYLPLDEPDLALAWTLRSAPHLYRRTDLAGVAAAVRPFSNADAAKRIIDAAKPLKAAGIDPLVALQEVAAVEREIVATPTGKGELSARLTDTLDEPYLRFCRPCNGTHVYEVPFRIAALQAGLELRPGTSPPVLQRIADWPQSLPAEVPGRLDVIRNYLHFYGPATPRQVAGFLDGALADVKVRWPADAVEVEVEGQARWVLASDLAALDEARPDGGSGASPSAQPGLRLLGPYDPYVQVKDRQLMVPDATQRKTLWPTLGRPGAVVADGEIVGTWRPRMTGKKLTVRLEDFGSITTARRSAIDHQAQLLAEFRGVVLAGIE